MGVKIWGLGLVAAAVISAVTASSAPVAVAEAAPAAVQGGWEDALSSSGLSASLAAQYVAETPRAEVPDKLTRQWPCSLPIHIFYAAAPGIDSRNILRELEYPVEYLRRLGYDVSIVREVAYRTDYTANLHDSDVLIVAAGDDAEGRRLHSKGWGAVTEARLDRGVTTFSSAKITVDWLTSAVLLHEFGHVLGLPHKDGSVMGVNDASSLGFDPAETAAIDCR